MSTDQITPPVTIRETLRPVGVPTETLRIVVPAKPTPAAQSPFGPVRRQQQPPVRVPGPRQPSDSIPPRPAPPTSRYAPDPKQVASWWQAAEDHANNGDAYDRHAAYDAFGNGAA
jgi:hypothetical protein